MGMVLTRLARPATGSNRRRVWVGPDVAEIRLHPNTARGAWCRRHWLSPGLLVLEGVRRRSRSSNRAHTYNSQVFWQRPALKLHHVLQDGDVHEPVLHHGLDEARPLCAHAGDRFPDIQLKVRVAMLLMDIVQ